ncbi:amidase family protein [Pseudomonas silesiensis]|uniref:amidase family protein n=1 Tax=Pseudomonas silesiensis TaxID=1853130 RepID=UPI003BB77EC1
MGQSSVGRRFNSASASTNQRFTEAVSHAGYPAISVPTGFTSNGLPVGMQIAAPHGRNDAVLNAAAVVEQVAPWAAVRPRL